MDEIRFLLVSVSSNRVQLHGSRARRRECACSEAGFSSQNDDHARGVHYRRAAFRCAFLLWAKGLNANDIHEEMFHVYSGKCLSRKAVQNRVDKFSQGRSKVTDNARPAAEVAEGTV
jgi:hypothetical protein